MNKRIVCTILAVALLALPACGKKKNKTEDPVVDAKPSQITTNDVDYPEATEPSESTYDPESWVNPGQLTSPHAIVNAAAKASPSVVAITTEVVSYGGFFGNYVSEGAGSGVIYSEDGYIITNNHVIEGADTVKVTLINGDEYDATIIGADAITDTAVLKIEATGLCAATPDASELLVGQPVIAIGNPMGTLSGTVTSGIVSSLSRWIAVEGVAMELLQFDAAVSPGNSGGGLFDLDGNLIAIVNAKSSGEGVEGISFAIPVARALDITEQFIEKGYISGRPGLGVKTDCITSTNYESFMESELWEYATLSGRVYPGLYITDTNGVQYENTENAFQFGDRIAKIGNKEIADESDLAAALSSYRIGDSVTVRVARKIATNSSFGGSNYTFKAFDITVVLTEAAPPAEPDNGVIL